MTLRTLSAAALALLALSACNQKPTEVTSIAPDPLASEIANLPPVELPPTIRAESKLRCKDNSVVMVTFFEGDKQVLVRQNETGSPIKLTAEKAGDPLKAEGFELTGTPKVVTLTQPGKPAQSCHV